MARIIEVTFEVVTKGEQTTYRVVTRVGNTGENPDRFHYYEGPDKSDALAALYRASRYAAAGKTHLITFPGAAA